MGGCINVFLRRPNGEFLRMRRWTNTVRSIEDTVLFPDTEARIDTYLDEWYKMRADWKCNKRHKNFAYPMTDVYFPPPTDITYSEYGAVFVDFVTKHVIAYNDYTRLFMWQSTLFHRDKKLPSAEQEYLPLLREAINCADFMICDMQSGEIYECKDPLSFVNNWGIFSDQDLLVHPRGWTMEQGMKGDCRSRTFKARVKEILEE